MLPDRVFLTGVPGSRWSGIAQMVEQTPGFNTSDRDATRQYSHGKFSGHLGAYFGHGMEHEPVLDADHIDRVWQQPGGTRLVKSHDWSLMLDQVQERFPQDWIMLVYRPDMASYAWWFEAGGFGITHPNYSHYRDSTGMLSAIMQQNQAILDWAARHDLTWNYFTAQWMQKQFGSTVDVGPARNDILVTIKKP